MTTWSELQQEITKAVKGHARRKSLRRRAVLLKALAMREGAMTDPADTPEHRVSMTIQSLNYAIQDLWTMRMKNETADKVISERIAIKTLAVQLHALSNDLIMAQQAAE